MPINSVPNPWIITHSDSEDEFDIVPRYDRSYSLPPKPPTPRLAAKPRGPIIPDWSPIVDDESNKKKFGRRKTAPSSEKGPANNRPIFSGPSSLKSSLSSLSPARSLCSSRNSLLEQFPVDRTPARSLCSSRNSLVDPSQTDKSTNVYTPETPPASPPVPQSHIDPFVAMQEDLNKFIYSYLPKDYSSFFHCIVRRDRHGLQKGFFPTYYLHVERPTDGKRTFLLAARKVAKLNRQSEYLITTNVETLSDKNGGDGFVGKLRANGITNTEYTLYDSGNSPNKFGYKSYHSKHRLRRELGSIIYNTNILGLKGPREMNVVIPKLEYDIQPAQDEETILDRWRAVRLVDLIHLRNQSPKFDDETRSHMLEFSGDIPVQPSVKNFQMIIENDINDSEVIMEFGRLSTDTFTCDFRFPLSPIQAFAVALSSFDSGLARE